MYLNRFKKREFIDIREDSQKTYNYQLKEFFKFIRKYRKMKQQNVLLRYKKYLLKKDYKTATINLKLIAARQVLRLNKIDFQDVKLLPNENEIIRAILTEEEVRRIVKIYKNSISMANEVGIIRDFFIFSLLISTGLRASEIINIKLSDIVEQRSYTVIYVKTKGNIRKDNLVVINDELKSILYDYIKAKNLDINNKNQYLLINSVGNKLLRNDVHIIIRRVFNTAGVYRKGLCVHSLRHTFATILVDKGVDPYRIKDALHHKNINTTMRYIKNRERLLNAPELMFANILK